MTTILQPHVAQDHDDELKRAYPGLLAYCRTLDWDCPEDLAQEAMTRTWQRLGSHEIDHLPAYLRTTARHVRADIVRAKRTHPTVVSNEIDACALEQRDVADDMAIRDGLMRAIALLSERERAVLQLSDVDDLSVAAIAAALDTTPAAAKSVLYRARQKVRDEIDRLKAKGMLAVAGPAASLRNLLAEGGANLGVGAATATIAVAATLGLSGRGAPDFTISAPALVDAAVDRPVNDPGAERSRALHVPDPGAAELGPSGRVGLNGRVEPSEGSGRHPHDQPPDRPVLQPRSPDPKVRRVPDDPRPHRAKPIYVASPEADHNCDGKADVYFAASDDPWAEEGGAVFGGSPPPGLEGGGLHADASSTQLSPTCG